MVAREKLANEACYQFVQTEEIEGACQGVGNLELRRKRRYVKIVAQGKAQGQNAYFIHDHMTNYSTGHNNSNTETVVEALEPVVDTAEPVVDAAEPVVDAAEVAVLPAEAAAVLASEIRNNPREWWDGNG